MKYSPDRFSKHETRFRYRNDPVTTVTIYVYESYAMIYDVARFEGQWRFRINCGPWTNRPKAAHHAIAKHFNLGSIA